MRKFLAAIGLLLTAILKEFDRARRRKLEKKIQTESDDIYDNPYRWFDGHFRLRKKPGKGDDAAASGDPPD